MIAQTPMSSQNLRDSFGTSALIGHTGFVGSNLLAQHPFRDRFNSGNIRDLAGRSYDLVACAGVSAVKWKANQDPDRDWAGIRSLLDVLATVRAGRFVLISTIDVYPDPRGVTESTPIHGLANHAYGSHRLRVEDFVRERFPRHHVLRLPGLFGPGLKKNVLYDLLNRNGLEAINPRSSFQYYNLDHLWPDVLKVMELELPLVNLATEPIRTGDLLSAFFPSLTVGQKAGGEAHYDMGSEFTRPWDRTGPYQYGREDVLKDLGAFIRAYPRAS
jgi:hypothetical protein